MLRQTEASPEIEQTSASEQQPQRCCSKSMVEERESVSEKTQTGIVTTPSVLLANSEETYEEYLCDKLQSYACELIQMKKLLSSTRGISGQALGALRRFSISPPRPLGEISPTNSGRSHYHHLRRQLRISSQGIHPLFGDYHFKGTTQPKRPASKLNESPLKHQPFIREILNTSILKKRIEPASKLPEIPPAAASKRSPYAVLPLLTGYKKNPSKYLARRHLRVYNNNSFA